MAYYGADEARSDPYLSIFTAQALGWFKELGYAPRQEVSQKLDLYLLSLLRNDTLLGNYSRDTIYALRAQAFAHLAQRGVVGYDEYVRLRDHLSAMSLFARTKLIEGLLVLPETHQEEVQRQVRAILAAGGESGGLVTFTENLPEAYSWLLESPVRTACAIADLSVDKRIQGEFPQGYQEKLIRSITAQRAATGAWATTQENLFCMMAYTAYAERFEKGVNAESVTITHELASQRETLTTMRLSASQKEAGIIERAFTAANADSEGAFILSREGTSRLYTAAGLTLFPQQLPQKAHYAGLEIERQYEVLENGVTRALKVGDLIKRGDSVVVTLTLHVPTPKTFIVVDDPLPAGLEPIQRELATSASVPPSYDTLDDTFYHRELRHDAARFYSSYVPNGTYTLRYVAQAIATGSFTALPPHASMMYHPDVYARGVPSVVGIRE
jgi:hypothetical protein